jgi:hypothetical protein
MEDDSDADDEDHNDEENEQDEEDWDEEDGEEDEDDDMEDDEEEDSVSFVARTNITSVPSPVPLYSIEISSNLVSTKSTLPPCLSSFPPVLRLVFFCPSSVNSPSQLHKVSSPPISQPTFCNFDHKVSMPVRGRPTL